MAGRSSLKVKGLLGLFTMVCGFGLMWSGALNEFNSQRTLSEARKNAITINPSTPDPGNNGKLVVAPGVFSVAGQIGDGLIKPGPYLVLKRQVEMFQWNEEWPRDSDQPEYNLGWHTGQRDFFRFKKPEGHENPLLLYLPEKKVAPGTKFSGFDGSRIAELIDSPPRLAVTPEMLVDPSMQLQDSKILIRRDPSSTGDSLGDMRIWYEAALPGDYTVMSVQADERSLVGADVSSELIIRQGQFDADSLLADEAGEVKRGSASIVYMGGVLFCLGLFSLLSSAAHAIDLRPRIQLRGVAAALLLSVAISLVVVAIFLILSLVG
jgi:hypothetical protein